MYRSPAFAVDDADELVALARAAAFGHLVVTGADGGLLSTPLPFVISDDGALVRAHLARPNPVWKAAPCEALLIVPVTDAYVSPSWYPSKRVDGKVVPTWNYEVVHAAGRLTSHDDPEWLARQIRDLTDLHESPRDQPWSVDDAPADYIATMVKGIVGIELAVTRLEGKRKLSQNRPEADVEGVIAALSEGDERDRRVAAAMRRPGKNR